MCVGALGLELILTPDYIVEDLNLIYKHVLQLQGADMRSSGRRSFRGSSHAQEMTMFCTALVHLQGPYGDNQVRDIMVLKTPSMGR